MIKLTDRESRIINRIDVIAKTFGFKQMKRLPKDNDVIYLSKWKDRHSDEVVLYKQDMDDKNLWVSFYNGSMSGNDPWTDWVSTDLWIDYFKNY